MTNTSLKIVILGSGGVGKTSIVLRFVRDTFDATYIPTINDTFEREFAVSEKVYNLSLIDTAGQDEMESITDMAIKDTDAALLVYSITQMGSFNQIQKFYDKLKMFSESTASKIVLVGNKCDLNDERQVQFSRAEEMAKSLNCNIFETSAKTGQNVPLIFEALINSAFGKNSANPKNDAAGGGCCSTI